MSELLNDYSTYIHQSRYARYRDDLGRRETWGETVDRLITFWRNQLIEQGLKPEQIEDDLVDVESAILNLEVMPSMRSLMTAGPALERCNVAGYNCAYMPIEHPRCFDELMYILMCGTGVGFSVERPYVNKLPEIAETMHETDTTIHVADSKIGWASSFRELVSLLYAGKVPQWDMSRVRPSGARLKTFGGRASGPEPLDSLFNFTVRLFTRAAGRKLTSIECHDLVCKVADIVVVGGVRRSALISLSNLSDDRMRLAKSGQWWVDNPQRALANNSYVADERPDFEIFLNEWQSLYESRSGERGIFSRTACKRQAAKNGRREEEHEFGTNPCQPAWAKVLTPTGISTIGDIKIGDKIWSKEGWTKVTNKWSTGTKPVLRYSTTSGVFYGTSNHRVVSNGVKIEAKDADSIDIITGPTRPRNIDPQDIMDGLVLGDGMIHTASNDKVLLCIGSNDTDYFGSEIDNLLVKYRPGISDYAWDITTTITADELPKTYDRRVPTRFMEDFSKMAGFLRGLYSANGSVAGNRITLKTASAGLAEDVQLLLNSLGIRNYRTTNKANTVQFNNGLFTCKESYDINISTDREKFLSTIGFLQQYKVDKVKIVESSRVKTNYDITDVTVVSEEEVFDITVDNPSHTYWTQGCDVSNCSEIILRPYQFCNLSEVIIRVDDTLEDLKRKVRIASIIGTWQSTLIDFKYLRKKWKDNCEEERLLGVSLTGICDHPVLSTDHIESYSSKSGESVHYVTRDMLTEMKDEAIKANEEWADRLGINQSTAVTCVKPSGTVSQLTNTASGIHPRFSKYYIRRVRNDRKDPLSQFLIDQGVPYEEDKMNKETYVFSFPIASPPNAKTAGEMTAMEQLNLWKVYAEHWCEHKPSMTCYYRDHEFLEVGNWVWNNFDAISGISFLPYTDHTYEQAPYEAVTEEVAKELYDSMPVIDWDKLVEYENGEDNTTGSQTLACTGNSCEI